MTTNQSEAYHERHRIYCAKSGKRCLVLHPDGICPDIRDCEACKAEDAGNDLVASKPLANSDVANPPVALETLLEGTPE